MRRARIKAMATVPARRKPAQNAKAETADAPKPTSTEAEGNVDPGPTIEAEKSEQSVNQTPELDTAKSDVDLKLEQPTSEPKAIESPITEESSGEGPPVEPHSVTIVCKKNSRPQKPAVLENIIVAPSEETKNASISSETPSVVKSSQTRTSFMRPTPRLDGGGRIRRNSVQGSGASASESEDDSRRGPTGMSNRVRNDSVSSAQSPKGRSQSSTTSVCTNIGETANEGDHATANVAKNLFTSTSRQKRKMVVSESARKLAEARREFLLKHEHKQPDKSKLIMYDLIYYNPVTNPMKKAENSAATSTQRTTSSVIAPESEEEEEEEDEPAEAMPVPQVKVGPDGSLVIDEQSLVIEHTGAKKSRQAMARTEALVDEDGNGNGFYKRRPKSKDWPKWETLKFYKALNTVGTDFLLMQSLFPTRSRQEIKLKFKKEEKMNPRLVEKALAYHQEFDIDSLKEDLATFEESVKKRSELSKAESQPAARHRGAKRKKSKSRRMAAASISEMSESLGEREGSAERSICGDEETQEGSQSGDQKKNGHRRVNAPADALNKSTTSSNESGSDTEIYQIKPTRSGRVPKVRKLQAPAINTLDVSFSNEENEDNESEAQKDPLAFDTEPNQFLNSKDCDKVTKEQAISLVDKNNPSWKSQNFQKSLSGISTVEPGSLVIVSRESTDDPGETVLQVYMVSSDIDDGNGKQNMTPVVLTPELLNTVTAGITKVEPINVKPE